VDLRFNADLDAPVSDVLAALGDLATYPHWLSIVGTATRNDADLEPAWEVELVGRVGFISRHKRVRMTRHVDETAIDGEGGRVRFERHELDGREHSPWILEASCGLGGSGAGSRVEITLHYGGAPPLPGLDLLLRHEASRAGRRLEAYLTERPPDT